MSKNQKKSDEFRTTVGVKQSTKDKLDRNRAPGQCYDGFISQMADLWGQSRDTKKGPARKRRTSRLSPDRSN